MFLSKYIKSLSISAALLFPLPALADEDLCNKLLPPELATGDYVMTAHNGVMTVGKMTIPWSGGGSKTVVHLFTEADKLVMTGDSNLRAEFLTQESDIDDWWGFDDDFISELELEDVDISLCPTTESLPRLLAEGSGSYFEGGRGDFKMNILVHDVTDKGIHASGIIFIWNDDQGQRLTIRFPFDMAPK